jgi:membrane protein
VAAVLWFAATSAFGWYVRNLARYNVLYGSIATAIALLVWMYLLALIALFGCEFNAERERLHEATR